MMILVLMTRQSSIDSSIQEVSDALGITFTRKVMPRDHEYDFTLRIEDLPSPHAFSIKILDEYLAWRIELAFDDFSAPLLQLMKDRFRSRRDGIQSFFDLAKDKNDQIEFRINGTEILKSSTEDWKEVTLRIKKSYFSAESEFPALSSVLLDFMCLILYLLVKDVEWGEKALEDGEAAKEISRTDARGLTCMHIACLCLQLECIRVIVKRVGTRSPLIHALTSDGQRQTSVHLAVQARPAAPRSEAELAILILSVSLQVLPNVDSLLDEVVEVLGNLGSEAVLLQDSEDLVPSDTLNLGDAIVVSEDDTDLRGRGALLGELNNLFYQFIC
jgi:hypothetical protein